MQKLAITGNLASGKSTVCKLFIEFGAFVLSTDAIVHRLLSPNTDIGKQIIELFNKDIVVNGQIERNLIAKKAFEDPLLLKQLEGILHPAVSLLVVEEYQNCKNRENINLFVVETPLLFESESDSLKAFFDWTLSVSADSSIRKKRFLESRNQGLEQFEKRNSRQLSQAKKNKMADFVIRNDASKEELKKAVFKLHQNLLNHII